MSDRLIVFFLLFLRRLPVIECFAANVDPFSDTSLRKVCSVLDEPFQAEAQAMASTLHIPCIYPDDVDEENDFDHLLRFLPFEVCQGTTTYALALESRIPNSKSQVSGNGTSKTRRKKPTQKQKPFFIDLCPDESSSIGKRCTKEGGSDLLIKAVGPNKCAKDGRQGPVIFDLTAGLGRDSLVLAMNGASEVHMVERDPIVAALLRDAIRRLEALSEFHGSDNRGNIAHELSKKLFLHPGDSVQVMAEIIDSGLAPPPDITYLDPMFPSRTKSAKVKKGMALLHDLLDTQKDDPDFQRNRLEDETRLLEEAYKRTTTRVVVKRPLKAIPIGVNSSLCPSYSIEGSLNRWDVYVR